MGLYTTWVHGTAFSPPEFPTQGLDNVDDVPYTDVIGMRRGPGAFWLGELGNRNWFHCSVPTPTQIDGAQVRLKRVFVMYLCGSGGYAPLPGSDGPTIIDVQVWEGTNRLQAFGPLERWGDHRTGVDDQNAFVMSTAPAIDSGIGISVQVDFSGSGQQLIQFASAGAEFETGPGSGQTIGRIVIDRIEGLFGRGG